MELDIFTRVDFDLRFIFEHDNVNLLVQIHDRWTVNGIVTGKISRSVCQENIVLRPIYSDGFGPNGEQVAFCDYEQKFQYYCEESAWAEAVAFAATLVWYVQTKKDVYISLQATEIPRKDFDELESRLAADLLKVRVEKDQWGQLKRA